MSKPSTSAARKKTAPKTATKTVKKPPRKKPGPKLGSAFRKGLRKARWALVDLRVARGLTQADLGRYCGVTRTRIGLVERGDCELTPKLAAHVANWLDKPAEMTLEALYAVSEREPAPHYVRNTGATRTVRATAETAGAVAVSPECSANVGPVCNGAEVRENPPT